MRGPSSPSVPCPYTDGMPVSLSLCPVPQTSLAQGPDTGSAGKHTSRTMHPGPLACVRHIVVVAVGLLGSPSPGQCLADAGFQGEAWLSVLGQEAWWVLASPGACSAREQGQGGPSSTGLNGHKILSPRPWPGANGRGLWSWAELVARAKAQSWRPRPQKGTIVVSERSRVSHQG